MSDTRPYLVLAAMWVEAEHPDDATSRIATAVEGTAISKAGAIVVHEDHEIARPAYQHDLRRLDLGEAIDWRPDA